VEALHDYSSTNDHVTVLVKAAMKAAYQRAIDIPTYSHYAMLNPSTA
jgi:hypothetical protein